MIDSDRYVYIIVYSIHTRSDENVDNGSVCKANNLQFKYSYDLPGKDRMNRTLAIA